MSDTSPRRWTKKRSAMGETYYARTVGMFDLHCWFANGKWWAVYIDGGRSFPAATPVGAAKKAEDACVKYIRGLIVKLRRGRHVNE